MQDIFDLKLPCILAEFILETGNSFIKTPSEYKFGGGLYIYNFIWFISIILVLVLLLA